MTPEEKERFLETREKIVAGFVKFRSNADNDDVTDGQWCAQNKFVPEWLPQLRKAEVQKRVLDARRTQYSQEFVEIDKALIKKAKMGDTKAAELLWRRHENWSPKIAEDNLKRNPTNKTFAELMKEV